MISEIMILKHISRFSRNHGCGAAWSAWRAIVGMQSTSNIIMVQFKICAFGQDLVNLHRVTRGPDHTCGRITRNLWFVPMEDRASPHLDQVQGPHGYWVAAQARRDLTSRSKAQASQRRPDHRHLLAGSWPDCTFTGMSSWR